MMTVALVVGACGSGRGTSGGDELANAPTTAASSGTFGSLRELCGPGSAKGATDQGVSDSSIQIGFGDDAGFPQAPGLNHQVTDAVKAFIKWCNAAGGINGRTVEGDYYDAKITDLNNVITEACAQDFFLVGEMWTLDAAQETVRRGCKLPAVPTSTISAQFANGPLMVSPNPNPVQYYGNAGVAALAKLFPDKIGKTSIVYGNYPATIDTKDKALSAFPQLGYKISCLQEYKITGEADWKPFVQKLKDCGVQFVYYIGPTYPSFENLLEAANQLDYKPVWYGDSQLYDDQFSKWNSAGFADNVYFRSTATPFEEAKESKATQQFLDILKANGGDANQLGELGASAFLLWATGAKECGSTLTRQCVLEKLSGIHEWTAGGLHAKTDPGANRPSECGLLMRLQGTTFVRVAPKVTNTYDCDPSYLAKVTGPVLDRAKLDDQGIAQL
jgi:ABC-type branched-subunit amino acid transport system substrate-binding protein